ncbi:MAG: hypothetical protein R2751_16075 [Bacteroidales bacterium]
MIEWAGLGLVLLLNVVYVFYGRGARKHRFVGSILIIYLSVLISMFASLAYHNQSLPGFGIRSAGRLFLYLFDFLLHFHEGEGDIIRLILFLACSMRCFTWHSMRCSLLV